MKHDKEKMSLIWHNLIRALSIHCFKPGVEQVILGYKLLKTFLQGV